MDKLMLCIYLAIFVTLINNSVVSSFFPDYAEDTKHVSDEYVGIIFSSISIGVFLSSLAVGKQLKKKGMKKLSLILGVITQVVGLGVFVFLEYVNDKVVFIAVAIAARFLTGIGQGLILTPCYAFLPLLYRDTLEEKIGYTEACTGLGLGIGPLIGGILSDMGYAYPFYVSAILTAIPLPLILAFVPYDTNTYVIKVEKKLRKKEEEVSEEFFNSVHESISDRMELSEKDFLNTSINRDKQKTLIGLKKKLKEIHQSSDEESVSVNYLKLLGDRVTFLLYLVTMVPTLGILFLDPTLQPYVIAHYNSTSTAAGVMFALNAFAYVMLCPLGSYMIQKVPNVRLMLFFGCLTTGVSFILIGPDTQILYFVQQKIWYCYLACTMTGICNIFLYIPVRLEFLNVLNELYPDNSNELNADISSALYSSAYAIGSCIGPLLGGVVCKHIGFDHGAGDLGVGMILLSLIFLLFGKVCHSAAKAKQTAAGHNELQDELLRENVRRNKTIQLSMKGRCFNPYPRLSCYSRGRKARRQLAVLDPEACKSEISAPPVYNPNNQLSEVSDIMFQSQASIMIN